MLDLTEHFEMNWLQNCPSDFKPYYYRRYVDDIFVLFTSQQHLKAFRNFLNGRHATCHLRLKVKRKTKCPFLIYRLIVKIKHLPPLKNILNCCKLQIVFKNKTRLGNNFRFKDRSPKNLTSGIVYKFQCGLCNSPIMVNV